ncbi:MAG: carboxymuconolactone decarboxylase family protein [Novosphingobium sp.]
MERFPVLAKADLDEKQLALWDELTLGPRGFYTGGAEAKRLPDLYNAWLQFPEFGKLMVDLGGAVRANAALPGKLRELVVLTTSALLGAMVEFDFHVPFATNEGLSSVLIEALRERREPPFGDEAERIAWQVNVQLLRTGALSHETREEAIEAFGYDGLMLLIANVTLYVATAYTTNVARVKLAEDFSADPNKLKEFFAGKEV